jgi:hypothetical protein
MHVQHSPLTTKATDERHSTVSKVQIDVIAAHSVGRLVKLLSEFPGPCSWVTFIGW